MCVMCVYFNVPWQSIGVKYPKLGIFVDTFGYSKRFDESKEIGKRMES